MKDKQGRFEHSLAKYILIVIVGLSFFVKQATKDVFKQDNPMELPPGKFKRGDIVTDVDNTWKGMVLREEYTPYRWYIVRRFGNVDEQPLKIRGSELRHLKVKKKY